MDIVSEITSAKLVYLDIETEVMGEDGKPSAIDKPVWVGFRQADGKKIMFHISRRDKIQQALSFFDGYIGHNIEYYDIPILENYGFNLSRDNGYQKIVIDTLRIFQKRAQPMMYLDLSLQQLSMESLSQRFNLPVQKGNIDYSVFNKSLWNDGEIRDIKQYLYGDLDTGWELFKWVFEFFYGFKHYMSPKSQRLFHWLRTSSGSNAYKIICHQAGLDETYLSDEDTEGDEDVVSYEGGFVSKPTRDFVEGNLYVVDWASLYPMMFLGGCLYSRVSTYEEHGEITPNERDVLWSGGEIFKSVSRGGEDGISGVYKRRHGPIEGVIGELYADRLKYKARMEKCEKRSPEYTRYDALQLATKITINTSYGITGSPLFTQLYDLYTAADCTAMARMSIKHTRDRLTQEGYDCMYTDSVTGDNDITFYHNNTTYTMTFRGFEYYAKMNIKNTVSIRDGKTRLFFDDEVLTPTMTDDKSIVWENIEYLMIHRTSKPCYRVDTGSGWVDVTEDHSMITLDNDELVETSPVATMKVIINTGINERHSSSVGFDRLIMTFYGYYAILGESVNDGYSSFHTTFDTPFGSSPDLIEDLFESVVVKPLLKEVSPHGKCYRSDTTLFTVASGFIRDAISERFYGHTAPFIPDWVLRLDEGDIIAFLRGVYLATGTKVSTGVGFRFKNIKVARKVSRLFKTVGVWGSISRNGRGRLFSIPVKDSEWFADQVGIINPLLSSDVTQYEDKPGVMQHSVKRVQMLPQDLRTVYDIEVRDTHRFFANDILVHNTDSVYIRDPFDDRERVERVCRDITMEQRNDFNVDVEFHNLEVEDKIDVMWFFRNDKGEYVKKLYAYLKDGADSISLKGVTLVKGDCSKLAKNVFSKYIEPDMLEHKKAQYKPEQVMEWVTELFNEDPTQLSKRFRPKKPSSYKRRADGKESTSIHYAIAKHYGEGEFWLVPNNAIGIGKGKKYALQSELEELFGDDWTSQVMLVPILNELKVFIPWEERKRAKKLQSSQDPMYYVDHSKKIVIKTSNIVEINQMVLPPISRKDWLKLRRAGMRDVNGK